MRRLPTTEQKIAVLERELAGLCDISPAGPLTAKGREEAAALRHAIAKLRAEGAKKKSAKRD